jgi:hypothetical protein
MNYSSSTQLIFIVFWEIFCNMFNLTPPQWQKTKGMKISDIYSENYLQNTGSLWMDEETKGRWKSDVDDACAGQSPTVTCAEVK